MEKTNNLISQMDEETFVVKELEGRVYFETLPLLTIGMQADTSEYGIIRPVSVTGVRG